MDRKLYKNGFRIVHDNSNKHSNIASIQVFCDVGSIHEPEDSRGSAHFIEHMCFKGTDNLKTSADINKIFVDQTGSILNAFTDRRHTCYYVTTNKDNLPLCINTVADMVLNSKFDKKEYLKERAVVKEEAIKDEEDYELLVLTNADQQIYAGSPYANSVDELKYHVGKNILQYEKVLEMYKKYYIPSNMILSICSAHSFADVCRMVEKTDFVKAASPIEPRPQCKLFSEPQSDIVFKIEKRETGATQLCIGFRTCPLSSPDKYAVKLLKTIVGDGDKMNNRLFTVLREENGLTYSSYAYTDFFEHMGDLKLFAECDSSKFLKNGSKPGVFPLVIRLIRDLLEKGVTDEEVRAAKTFIEAIQIMKSEDAEVIAKYNGKKELYGNLAAPTYRDKFKQLIAPITRRQINDCIRKYLVKQGMVVSIVAANPPSEKTLRKLITFP
jgi:predicted Zn-dependent peptidase